MIVVSKTFTTAETMLNARTLKDWLLTRMKGKASPDDITRSHIVSSLYTFGYDWSKDETVVRRKDI